MPQFRFYLCGTEGHFLRVREIECDDAEVKATALRMLHDEPSDVIAIEVWNTEKPLARVERA